MTNLLTLVDHHRYQELFIEELNWHRPDQHPLKLTTEAGTITVENVSSYKGLRVWVCNTLPGTAVEAEVDRAVAKTTNDRLVIFHDGDKQVWRWPVRRTKDDSVQTRLARHRYTTGELNPGFETRIRSLELPLEETLSVTDVLVKVRAAFDVESHRETRHASQLMARLYAALEKAYPANYTPSLRDREISTCLARILFLVFGDDTEMWEPDAFRDYLRQHTKTDASDLAQRLTDLFSRLDSPDIAGDPVYNGFKYVNGGLFSEPIVIPSRVGAEFRQALMDACALDWSSVSPAIFGSMFQSVRNAETRRSLGEHYTSEENILKTLNPLFLDDLRADYAAAVTRDTERKQINALEALWKRLGDIRFMDPACGCGNFIIVAYRELRDLELNVIDTLRELRGHDQHTLPGDAVRALRVTLDHFFGIEIDEWPATLAQTAMFLIDRQCDLKLRERFGEAPERLPIQLEAKIVVDNALAVDWTKVCPPGADVVIAGNPPFLGDHTRTKEQLADLQAAWGPSKTLSRLDFVTGWHAKALRYFQHHDGLWAFVTTNSITQGDQVERLFSEIFAAGWIIKFAHRTFAWTSEAAGAAAVHCVIIGYTRDTTATRRLFDYATLTSAPQELEVSTINAYLVDAINVLTPKRSQALARDLPPVVKGSMPTDGGHLVVTSEQYPEVAADPIAAKYLRPYIGSKQLIEGTDRWCLWLEAAPPEDLVASPILRQRVDAVRHERAKSTAATTRDFPHHHLFRQRGLVSASPIVGIPEVSSENRPYLPVGYLAAGTIISNKVYGAVDPSGVIFAVASSAMFITWMRTVGGRLESRLSFSSTLSWNNFPLPDLHPDQVSHIAEAGRAILRARSLEPTWSLEDHYEPTRMHPAVLHAHTQLDRIVDRALGLDVPDPSELERQEALFEAYAALISK